MKNYSAFSDFEINKAVAEYDLDGDWLLEPTDDRRFTFFNLGVAGKRTAELPNYCNNPSHAWPIILNNRISMVWDCAEDSSAEWWNAVAQFDECSIQYQSNPLRAAMIVYLMMKESEHEN